ncbi:MAG TPA: methyltransferase, partial [Candidatus Lokiarchaeia archaeon]|nr:methyltransferase [Candidatus Lokiarchaeia archaeon]
KVNASNNQVEDRVAIIESDLFSQMPEGTSFDWIIFNPPYLPASDDVESPATKLQTEGGPSGLRVIRRFLEQVPSYLNKEGRVFFIASSLSPLKFIARLSKGEKWKLYQRQVKHAFFEDIILFELQLPEC